jgi:hypothetical protein
MTLTTNVFSGLRTEYSIPNKQIIFVSDFFVEDIKGGAELTTEAIQSYCPTDISFGNIHASSLKMSLLKRNKNKHYVFGNATKLPKEVLIELSKSEEGYSYSIIEYDFKFCFYRNVSMHLLQKGELNCDCLKEHKDLIQNFYTNAKRRYWMSEKQLIFTSLYIDLKDTNEKDFVLSSVFKKETLDKLCSLKQIPKEQGSYGVLKEGSWVKGIQLAKDYCKTNNIQNVKELSNPDYDLFLRDLSGCENLIFTPLGWDTCPRLVIEAMLMGVNVIVNDNVFHIDEEWLKSEETQLAYLKNNVNEVFFPFRRNCFREELIIKSI